MFDSLGVTDSMLAIYRALLERPHLTASALPELLGLPPSVVEEQMDRLFGLRLLVPRWTSGDNHGQEYAVHPSLGFALLTQQRQDEIDGLLKNLRDDQASAQTFSEQYSDILRQRTARESEILEGQEHQSTHAGILADEVNLGNDGKRIRGEWATREIARSAISRSGP